MACPVEIVNEELGVYVLKGIPKLTRIGSEDDVILRRQQRLVYKEAIESADEGYRVCLTGNPGIGKTFTTPGGTPASSRMGIKASIVNGVSEAGLTITGHPAAKAGPIFRVPIAAG